MVTGALSTDAAMGSSAPFEAEIHTLRGHRGQKDVAAAVLDARGIRGPAEWLLRRLAYPRAAGPRLGTQ